MPWNRNTESQSDHAAPRTVGLDDHARREADDPVAPRPRLPNRSRWSGVDVDPGPGSEKALADLAVRELPDNSHPRVLIGGLGLGFTLGAALDVLPVGASVVIVEFFETVVDWNRKFDFESATDRLADPRVVVEVTDVVDYLRKVKQPFDAIVLDVDNGPDAWCLESNERLYDRPGLIRIRRALKPAGLLSVWSARGSSVFENRLAEVGFAVRSETVSSRESKGERHTIFLGIRG